MQDALQAAVIHRCAGDHHGRRLFIRARISSRMPGDVDEQRTTRTHPVKSKARQQTTMKRYRRPTGLGLSLHIECSALPGDEIDGSRCGARREELQREPAVAGLHPALHLVPQTVGAVSVQHRCGTSGALLGAVAAVTGATGVTLTGVPVPIRSLVHHDSCASVQHHHIGKLLSTVH